MKIWVDGDGCPVVIKQILFKAAQRRSVNLILVANRFMQIPKSVNIKMLQVQPGFDEADNEIVKRMMPGDLVITSDLPLAGEVIDKKGFALSPRGEFFSAENIRARLNMRDFMDTLRGSGLNTSGPPPLSQSDRQLFANQLDRFLTQELR